jgi:Flp pilus assembly protein TadG
MLKSLNSGRDRGANLVEFAILVPLLLILVLGVVEFGFFLGERNELKHGAHEAARLAAVNDPSLLTNTCNAFTLLNGTVTVDFEQITGNKLGDQASVTTTATVSSLTGLGLIEAFLPSDMTVTAEFRLEQDASWSNASADGSC